MTSKAFKGMTEEWSPETHFSELGVKVTVAGCFLPSLRIMCPISFLQAVMGED